MSRQKKYSAKPAEEKTKAGKSKRGREEKGMCQEDRPIRQRRHQLYGPCARPTSIPQGSHCHCINPYTDQVLNPLAWINPPNGQ